MLDLLLFNARTPTLQVWNRFAGTGFVHLLMTMNESIKFLIKLGVIELLWSYDVKEKTNVSTSFVMWKRKGREGYWRVLVVLGEASLYPHNTK